MERYRILVKAVLKHDDKFFVVEKWYDDNIVNPFQWEFLTEEVEYGEGPDSEVIRVISEQLGIDAIISKILYTWSFMIGTECNLGIAYLCEPSNEDFQVVLSEDLHDGKWVDEDELGEYISNKRMLNDLKNAGVIGKSN